MMVSPSQKKGEDLSKEKEENRESKRGWNRREGGEVGK